MEMVTLDSVCEIVAGQSPPSEFYNQDGNGLPFFQGKADFGEIYPTVRYWCEQPKKIALPNDILLSVRAPVGSTNICNQESCIGRGLSAIRAGEKINYKYLFYFFRSYEKKLSGIARGSTFTSIIQADIEEIKFPLRPFSEQLGIANILTSVDTALQKRRESIKLTEQFLQSAFLEMFGDPVRNEKCWERKNVSQLVTSHNHRRIPVKASIRDTKKGIYPYYGASGIIDHVDDYIFDSETLMIGEDGANLLMRTTPISFIATGKYWVNNHVHVLVPNKEVNIQYLKHYFNSISLEPYLTGSAQPKLNAGNLAKISVPIPSLPLQQKFAALVDRVEKLQEKQRESESDLENLFGSLMQRYFG